MKTYKILSAQSGITCVNIFIDIACSGYRFYEIICFSTVCSIFCIIDILFPYKDGVISCLVFIPFCINMRCIRYGFTKFKFFFESRIRIPASKLITIFDHGYIWLSAVFSIFYKLRRNICATVLMEYDPMSFRSIYSKYHVSRNINCGSIRIDLSFGMSLNVCTAKRHFPSFKIFFCIRSISLVYSVTDFCTLFISSDFKRCHTQ